MALLGIAACAAPTESAAPIHTTATGAWSTTLSYQSLRSSWASRGRRWIEHYTALEFEATHWRQTEQSVPRERLGSQAYYVQYATEAGVEMALQCNDTKLEEELLELFLLSLAQFETTRSFATNPPRNTTENRFEHEDRRDARTLGWLEPRGDRGGRFRECELCMTQWFHPASRLLRAIAERPPTARSTRALRFSEAMWPTLVHDHLIRLSPESRPELWDTDFRVTDRQLWMGANAAQALAAHHADPVNFPLTPQEEDTLLTIVARSTSALLERRHDRFEDGRHLLSFFDGVEAGTPIYRHAGHAGPELPTEPAPVGDVGWDVAHYHRIPIVLRSLSEARHATGQKFPNDEDLAAVADHFATRVYVPGPRGPGLVNFSDGSDGWFRVDADRDFGFPPMEFCDATDRLRPCLTGPAMMGWGRLVAYSPRLEAVLRDFADLATASTSAHRTRLLTYNQEEFTAEAADGDGPATLVLFIFGSMPAKLPGCQTTGSG